ncbi:MAG: hypothetical protein Q9M13_01730, partial [Mariprofundales bacterium]|nr:hypothetical protein [Mariprofundales bacterium]
MKKALISAAAFAVVAVSSIAIAPTTSEAIPAFARQTGAACLSCHFQTFPALTAFGRAFKMGAFTDVGDQALVEDDNLSLPSVLNASFVLRAQRQTKKVTTGGTKTTTTTWKVPADAVLLMAGRVGTNTGAFVEFNGGAANWQLMNSIDFGSFKGGLNIQNTGFGPTAAIEISNVFGQHGGKLNGKALSAINTIIGGVDIQGGKGAGNLGNTTSVAGWIGNEMGLIQLGGVAFADAAQVSNNSFIPMVRAVLTTELGGADALVCVGVLSGEQRAAGVSGYGVNALFMDLQLQGELGDISYGLYGDFVTTKAKGVNGNGGAIGAANPVTNNIFSGTLANAKRDGYSLR